MSLLVPWLVFPIVLTLVTAGCGLFVERVSGVRLAGALLVPCGLAVIVVVAGLATMTDATARLATPAVLVLAAAGLLLAYRRRDPRRPDRWAVAAAVGVFAVFAAPIVLSGQATFAGYITLDDTATWLGITDRIMEHGRSLAGLKPSTYEAVLDANLKQSGYPIGSFLPLGVGRKLVGQDIAWLFQPYIAFLAAGLALSLYSILARLVASARLRALVAFVAAQAALLYGYAIWSGIKEVTSAALIALFAALLPGALGAAPERRSLRALVPLGLAVAAELVALTLGGLAWLLTGLGLAAIAAVSVDARALTRKIVVLTGVVAVFALPALVTAASFLKAQRGSAPLTSSKELGNLLHPLSLLQLFGIWPAGDFRVSPKQLGVTHVLVGVVVVAAAAALWWAWRRRAWAFLLYLATVAIGAVLLISTGSPWVDGKAMATASPAFVLAALAAAAVLFERGRRIEAAVVASVIAGGVLWSNVLAYHDAWLAPRSQLVELERIGKRFAHQGPSLMTEFEPYGVRHFLRNLDPEGASEYRRRLVPLRNGQLLGKGAYADIDRFDLSNLLIYRTLVLRRSPSASRPPSTYRLAWRGRYYEVWQRPAAFPSILEHLSLGDEVQPAATPRCVDVLRLGRLAARLSGRLATVERPQVTVALLSETGGEGGPVGPQLFSPSGHAVLEGEVDVPTTGRYQVWLGGSFRTLIKIAVDGRVVGMERHRLNAAGQYNPFGQVDLQAGSHAVKLEQEGPDLSPGSGGPSFPFGPLIFSRGDAERPVTYLPPARARSLCGKTLDGIEALG